MTCASYSYAWYCHVDDDMYVNVPRLSQFLQQYDPNKPYYFGKWPRMQRGGEANVKVCKCTCSFLYGGLIAWIHFCIA